MLIDNNLIIKFIMSENLGYNEITESINLEFNEGLYYLALNEKTDISDRSIYLISQIPNLNYIYFKQLIPLANVDMLISISNSIVNLGDNKNELMDLMLDNPFSNNVSVLKFLLRNSDPANFLASSHNKDSSHSKLKQLINASKNKFLIDELNNKEN